MQLSRRQFKAAVGSESATHLQWAEVLPWLLQKMEDWCQALQVSMTPEVGLFSRPSEVLNSDQAMIKKMPGVSG